MSKYLYLISHPAHFHMFKHSMRELQEKGHTVITVIRPKDVLEKLCIDSNLNFIKIKDRPNRFGMLGLAWSLFMKDLQILRIVNSEKPDQLVGSDGSLARVGFLKRIPSFEYSEDDAEAIKLYAVLSFPFYTNIVCPEVTSAWHWNYKKIGYKSYHELAYLHPNQFTPDKNIVNQYFPADDTYFIIRFAKLTAHHDVGIGGITTEIAQRIIDILKPYGKIYITSERELEPQFEQYRMHIRPLDMHHIMAFASIYIGDSQTMAAEAGVLGTPFIRFNDFVGRLSYLNELEWTYELGYGHKTNDVEGMLNSIKKTVENPDRKKITLERRQKMLSEKIDFAKFQVWFIENYPESARIMKENPDYQLRFR